MGETANTPQVMEKDPKLFLSGRGDLGSSRAPVSRATSRLPPAGPTTGKLTISAQNRQNLAVADTQLWM